jgi:fructose-1,6-bisphosphatase I
MYARAQIRASRPERTTMTSHAPVIDTAHIPAPLAPIIEALAAAAVELDAVIGRGPLGQSLGTQVGENTDGDTQKALDVQADEMFAARMRQTDVRWYASEEQDSAQEMTPQGAYAVAIDPLDGSSNIDVNVSIGTIFSILDARDDAEATFLRPASEQLAGGYVIYGPHCALVVTFGDGVLMFVLDREKGVFVLAETALRIPDEAREFAINASNRRHWKDPVRAYVDACLAGAGGPRGRDFNMRWVGSLVAEAHRILSRGGVFLYPGDARQGYARGRLRMVYECAPIAFVAEQAGGLATDGQASLMAQQADGLHARSPLVFGSAEEVREIARLHAAIAAR